MHDNTTPPTAKDEDQAKRETSVTTATKIRGAVKDLAFSSQEILFHFQTLLSAGYTRMFMEAPGLYFPEIFLYVISKAGYARGHASLYNEILPHLPEDVRQCYGFVIFPESALRNCLDKVLRRTAKKLSKNLHISMDNVFNRKHHGRTLSGSRIEQELINLMASHLDKGRDCRP